MRAPYFGDTHVHTAHSIDAVVFNVLGTPADAYEFARGGEMRLAPYDVNGKGTRPLKLRRPLDFAMVADHSEGFGAFNICFVPGYPGYDSTECGQARAASVSGDPATIQTVFQTLLAPVVVSHSPRYPTSVCGSGGVDCIAAASVVWQENQDVAEQFYDRTAECKFTSFVGYEWTGQPSTSTAALGSNLHRNVVFRNAVVPDLPISYVEEQKPQKLWQSLREKCQMGKPGCDWLAIPHNSNFSDGTMFATENADGSAMTMADAKDRIESEPLVEIYQHKGSSECRTGVGTNDELCGFELQQRVNPNQDKRDPNLKYKAISFVREAMKLGLKKEQELGANPFQYGVIASTDTHNAIAGATVERDQQGHSGLNDDTPEKRLYLGGPAPCPADNDPNNVRCGRGRAEEGSGGLAVVWAEENSRDALFAAMRRRETYGTSGIRPILRFFAGNFASDMCGDPDLAKTGYSRGVPMGAEIGPFSGTQSPTFTVLAVKDPGEPAVTMGDTSYPAIPGTPLQRIQIVKGWVDGSGAAQEKVFDVAGDPNNGASVDLATCTPIGQGFDSLCTAWADPEFDPGQRAFYYARVLENPTCRVSTFECNAFGVDCSNPDSVPGKLAACCEPTIPKTHQERAWSSPIWYRPEGLGAVRGSITFGSGAGKDQLHLEVPLGAGVTHDLATDDLTIVVRDDDVVLQTTLTAGSVKDGVYEDSAGSHDAVKKVTFSQTGDGAGLLTLQTVPVDLSRAERASHMLRVEVQIGSYTAAQTRLWLLNGATLGTTN